MERTLCSQNVQPLHDRMAPRIDHVLVLQCSGQAVGRASTLVQMRQKQARCHPQPPAAQRPAPSDEHVMPL